MKMKKSTHVLVFHDGSAVTTGIPLHNWKNVIKLIPLLIQPDVLSFSVPLCLSGVLVTKHILPKNSFNFLNFKIQPWYFHIYYALSRKMRYKIFHG